MVQPDSDPFPAIYPGYRFDLGRRGEPSCRSRLTTTRTDANGNVNLPIELAELPDMPQPLKATLRSRSMSSAAGR